MGNEPRDVDPEGPRDQGPGAQDSEPTGAGQGAGSGAFEEHTRTEQDSQEERYLANWQRAEADLANVKRRAEQEKMELGRFANASLISKILPVLDDFERALESAPPGDYPSSWVEGVKIIDKKLRGIMESEGVSPIDAMGKEFDPHFHQAVMQDEGDGDTDVVVEEYQKGYRLHDRVIRPTMVKVGRRNKRSDSKEK